MVSRLKQRRVIREGAELDSSNVEVIIEPCKSYIQIATYNFNGWNIVLYGIRITQYSGIRLTYC